LGLYSPVPIHKITVVPNLRIDPDYTLDDFIYTLPQTADMAHPEKYTTQFRDGERVLCREVSFTAEGVCLMGLPARLPDRTRPLADLVRVLVPDDGKEKPVVPGVFVELRDGSIVFGARPSEKGAAPVFARRPGLLQEQDQIVGLWSAGHPRATWLPLGP